MRTNTRLTTALAGRDPGAADERARIARAGYLRLLVLGVPRAGPNSFSEQALRGTGLDADTARLIVNEPTTREPGIRSDLTWHAWLRCAAAEVMRHARDGRTMPTRGPAR